jgi:hypothetical protein
LLLRVILDGFNVTAEDVLSLACLPRLSHVQASRGSGQAGKVAELEEARRRTRQQLLNRGAADHADRDSDRPMALRARESSVHKSPLGPHQQQEMRQRVLDETGASRWLQDDLLATAEGEDADAVRDVFFAELRSVLTAAAAR